MGEEGVVERGGTCRVAVVHEVGGVWWSRIAGTSVVRSVESPVGDAVDRIEGAGTSGGPTGGGRMA